MRGSDRVSSRAVEPVTAARRWVADPARLLLRLRWRLTVAYLLVGAAAIAGMTILVVRADSREREVRLDAAMRVEAATAATLIRAENGRLTLDDLAEQEATSGGATIVVLEGTPPSRQVYVHGSLAASVERSEMRSVAARAVETGRASRAADTGRVRLLAMPVAGSTGAPVGAVVVVGDPATVAGGRTSLLLALVLAGAGVLLLMAAGSHLLAGRTIASMRLVLQQHTRFVAEATHDLRRPIADLRDLAIGAVGDPSHRHDLPSNAVRLCARADDVVDDVLIGVKLDAGTFPLLRGPLRLDWLVENVVATTATAIGADGRADVATRPCTVVADAFLLRHALGHLVENALGHGRVEVRVFGDGRVTVADQGPGVDSGVVAALHHPSAEPTTLGRGLVICRWTAQLHGGALTVSQRIDGGAVWTLRLRPEAAGLGPATPEQQAADVSPGTWE